MGRRGMQGCFGHRHRVFCRWCRHFPDREEKQPLPQRSSTRARQSPKQRKSWKKRGGCGPTPAPQLFASSQGRWRRRPGALHGLKRNVAFVVFPWSFNPCSICISATAFQTLGVFFPSFFSFFSSPTQAIRGIFTLILQNYVCSETIVFMANYFPPTNNLLSALQQKNKQKRNSG